MLDIASALTSLISTALNNEVVIYKFIALVLRQLQEIPPRVTTDGYESTISNKPECSWNTVIFN